jgi:hypothetical protein
VQENFSNYRTIATQHIVKDNGNTRIANVENDIKFYKLKIEDDEVLILECLRKMK